MDIRMAAALAGQVDNVAGFCRSEQISRQTFYKFRQRFRDDGIDGLQDRSRRPLTSPGQTSAEVEDMVVRRRKQLIEQGRDHGAQSIVWSLQREGLQAVPSQSTVWQILTRRGAITPQPQKRPKSATKRFCFARPNECWQSDWTGWSLADGSPVAIAGSLDDHSRYVVGLRADDADADGELVWSVILAGIDECGIPSMSLSDNGIVYTGRFHAHESAFEINLRALGVRTINSAPFHPQTCGKIERFWQTLKKWLRARGSGGHRRRPQRPTRGVPQLLQPPASAPCAPRGHPSRDVHASTKARPADRPLPAPVFVSRHTVDENRATLRPAVQGQRRPALGRPRMRRRPRRRPHHDLQRHQARPRFTADPTRYHQRADKNSRTYRTREPKATP